MILPAALLAPLAELELPPPTMDRLDDETEVTLKDA